MSFRRALLVVFLKYPEAGKVKTRLAAGIGAVAAAEVYRELASRAVRVAGEWGRGLGRVIWLHFDPPGHEAQIREWLAGLIGAWAIPYELRPQAAGSLGTRLATVFADGFNAHYQSVIAIGTDCPELTCAELEAATEALSHADLSLGPTPDGGYYLIGLNRLVSVLFEGIPWSSSQTLAATLAAAQAAGLRVAMLDQLSDVDTEQDWRSWLARSEPKDAAENY